MEMILELLHSLQNDDLWGSPFFVHTLELFSQLNHYNQLVDQPIVRHLLPLKHHQMDDG